MTAGPTATRHRGRALPLAALALALLACGSASTLVAPLAPRQPARAKAGVRYVDRARLMHDVVTLSGEAFEGRRTSTPGGVRARQWIRQAFESIGLKPAMSSGFDQRFSFTHRPMRRMVLPGGRVEKEYPDAANLIGRIDGESPDARWIVVSAHYDHLGIIEGAIHPGADDNASGVAALLAAARHFTRHRPKHTLVIAAFDAEELGLRGARHFVSDQRVVERTLLNINLDMVSRNDRSEVYAAGTYHYPWTRPILEDVQRRTTVHLLFGHDKPPAEAGGADDWTTQSDHAAFHEAGVPFVYFGVEDHADYHKPTDTADRIDPRFFGDAADMIVDAIRTFDARLGAGP